MLHFIFLTVWVLLATVALPGCRVNSKPSKKSRYENGGGPRRHGPPKENANGAARLPATSLSSAFLSSSSSEQEEEGPPIRPLMPLPPLGPLPPQPPRVPRGEYVARPLTAHPDWVVMHADLGLEDVYNFDTYGFEIRQEEEGGGSFWDSPGALLYDFGLGLAQGLWYYNADAKQAEKDAQERAQWAGMLRTFDHKVQLYDMEKTKLRELVADGIPEDFGGISYRTHVWDVVMPFITEYDEALEHSKLKDISIFPQHDVEFVDDMLKALARYGIPAENRKIVWPHVIGAAAMMRRPENAGRFERYRNANIPLNDRGVIDRDLYRTFPSNCLFRDRNPIHVPRLNAILTAYVAYQRRDSPVVTLATIREALNADDDYEDDVHDDYLTIGQIRHYAEAHYAGQAIVALLDVNADGENGLVLDEASIQDMANVHQIGQVICANPAIRMSGPTAGYTQGMGYVAAFFVAVFDSLDHAEDLETAFWCFTQLLEDPRFNFISYYVPNFTGFRDDSDRLLRVVRNEMPRLKFYLSLFGDVETNHCLVFLMSWFGTLLTPDIFKSEVTARIWDAVFTQGHDFFLRVVLVLFKRLDSYMWGRVITDRMQATCISTDGERRWLKLNQDANSLLKEAFELAPNVFDDPDDDFVVVSDPEE